MNMGAECEVRELVGSSTSNCTSHIVPSFALCITLRADEQHNQLFGVLITMSSSLGMRVPRVASQHCVPPYHYHYHPRQTFFSPVISQQSPGLSSTENVVKHRSCPQAQSSIVPSHDRDLCTHGVVPCIMIRTGARVRWTDAVVVVLR